MRSIMGKYEFDNGEYESEYEYAKDILNRLQHIQEYDEEDGMEYEDLIDSIAGYPKLLKDLKLQNNRLLCYDVVEKNGEALEYVKSQTPRMCLKAIKNDPNALIFVDKRIKGQHPKLDNIIDSMKVPKRKLFENKQVYKERAKKYIETTLKARQERRENKIYKKQIDKNNKKISNLVKSLEIEKNKTKQLNELLEKWRYLSPDALIKIGQELKSSKCTSWADKEKQKTQKTPIKNNSLIKVKEIER